MEEVEFKRKQIIFKEGDIGNHFYFIKHGEVELIKHVERPDGNERNKTQNKSKNILSPRTQLTKKIEIVKLGIETEKDYLGEYEILDLKPMEYTAIAHSTTVTLMVMNREKFVSLVKDDTSLKCLDIHCKKKRHWRDDLIDKFLKRCKSQKAKDSLILDEPKSALNKKVFQEYFQSSTGNSPANRINRFNEAYKPATSLEDLTLPTSPIHAERLVSSTKNNNFTAASGFFPSSTKATSTNTFETDQANFTRFVLPTRSQKKMHGQTYVDHRKWLEETLKGTDNSKIHEAKK